MAKSKSFRQKRSDVEKQQEIVDEKPSGFFNLFENFFKDPNEDDVKKQPKSLYKSGSKVQQAGNSKPPLDKQNKHNS